MYCYHIATNAREMEMGNRITVLGIRKALKDSKEGRQIWLSESMSGGGSLALLARRGHAYWYFRYSPAKGANVDNLPLGAYSEDAELGTLTLGQAKDRAGRFSELLRNPETRNIRAFQAEQQRTLAEARTARKAVEAAKSQFTLGHLLRLYVDSLEARNAPSAPGTRSALELHIHKRRPELAAKPAQDVDADDITDVVAALNQEGKQRTAGLVRSHLSAAFNLGRKGNTNAPEAMRAFNLKANPVLDTSGFRIATRDRVLTSRELRAFLIRLGDSTGAVADLVRACVLLGGQRPQQIARTRVSDFDPETGTLTLMDGKGIRLQPRRHQLPLCKAARELIEHRVLIAGTQECELLFSSEGRVPVQLASISKWIGEIVVAMMEAGEVKEAFQTRDLRRTAETQLASLGITMDIRAQLLSHGLSGIQSQRYDRHDYMAEKRAALKIWERHLEAVRTGKAMDTPVRHMGEPA